MDFTQATTIAMKNTATLDKLIPLLLCNDETRLSTVGAQ